MKKIWYLSTCNTCIRIMEELNINSDNFNLIDIKNNPINIKDLETIQNNLNCSYENLFNKRAIKYSKTELKTQIKTDKEFKEAILKEYTFLKRPIIQVNNKFFVGNSKKVVEACRNELIIAFTF